MLRRKPRSCSRCATEQLPCCSCGCQCVHELQQHNHLLTSQPGILAGSCTLQMQLQQQPSCSGFQGVNTTTQVVGACVAAPTVCRTSCSAYGTTQQPHVAAGQGTTGCTFATFLMPVQCAHAPARMTYPPVASCSMDYTRSSSMSGCSPGTFSSCSVGLQQEQQTGAPSVTSSWICAPTVLDNHIGTAPFSFQLHQVVAPVCFAPTQQQGSVHSTPALLTSHSSARSTATGMDGSSSCTRRYRPADSLLLLAQEQIVMGVQLASCEAAASSNQDASMQSAFQQPGRRDSVTSGRYQPLTGCKRPASLQQQESEYLSYKCPRTSRAYASAQWSITPGSHTAQAVKFACQQLPGVVSGTGTWQLTPCDAPQPHTAQKRVSSAPRLLRQLSPASIKRCCQVGSSTLLSNSVMPGWSLFEDLGNRNLLQLSGMKRLASIPAPPVPLPPDASQFFGAAMRLCGYTEVRTIKLATHCWQRIQERVVLDLPRLALQLQATGCDCEDLQRAVWLAVLWLAGKCEEPRIQQAKASVVWCLAPASLASLGASCLGWLETRVMSLLDWSPYRGLLW